MIPPLKKQAVNERRPISLSGRLQTIYERTLKSLCDGKSIARPGRGRFITDRFIV